MAFTLGDSVGPYRIVDQIGQGGMATVFKAYHANLDRYVAVKVLHAAFKEDPNFLERFKREAQIVARLDHPNIIPIYDFADFQGQPYLVMKFIAGETLKARLKRGPLTLDETLRFLDQVARALTYAHQQGVLHRDIKPSNIMLDEQGAAFVADFGLARIAQAGESTMSQDVMLGTPQYISPEQAKGIRELGPGTDIYSLGVLLYEVIVGRVPFSADTPYAIVHDHIYKALPLPSKVNPSVPIEIERVLLKALAKEPEARFTSAEDMVRALEQAIQTAGLTEISAVHYRPQDQVSSTAATIPPEAASPPPASTPQYMVIPAPLVQGSTASKQAYRRRANLWILGGIGALLTTCLVSLFIIVNAVSDPEMRPWNVGDSAEAVDAIPSPAGPIDILTGLTMDDLMTGMTMEEAEYLAETEGDPMAYLYLGMMQMTNGQRDAAFESIGQAIAAPDVTNEQIVLVARRIADAGHTELATWLYLEALTRDEQLSPAIRNEAGEVLYRSVLATPIEMRAILNRFAERHVENASIHTLQALATLQTERAVTRRQAISSIEAALALDDSLAETYLVRGLYYRETGEIDRALADWARAASLPDAPEWVIREARVLQQENSGDS